MIQKIESFFLHNPTVVKITIVRGRIDAVPSLIEVPNLEGFGRVCPSVCKDTIDIHRINNVSQRMMIHIMLVIITVAAVEDREAPIVGRYHGQQPRVEVHGPAVHCQ